MTYAAGEGATGKKLPKSHNSEFEKHADALGESSSSARLSSEASQSYVQTALTKATAVFTDNKTVQSEVSRYGASFLVTAALFTPGRIGLAGTVILGALDQASPNSSASAQLADLTLGGLKGAGMRGVMHAMGSEKVTEMIGKSPAAKGVAFGFANRTLDGVLTRQNYLDGSGKIDGTTFGTNFMRTVANPTAIMSDAATFIVAHGLTTGVSKFNPAFFERSPLAQTVATSASFGLSNGASGEIVRQQDAHEKFDLTKIVGRSLLQGGIDAFAGVPGGMKANYINRSSFERKANPVEEVKKTEQMTEKADLSPSGIPGELHSRFARSKSSLHINLHAENNTVTRFVQADNTDAKIFKSLADAAEKRRTFIGPVVDSKEQAIRELTIPARSLAQQPDRITGFKTEVEKLAVRSDIAGPFSNFDDFCNRGLDRVPTEVRKYSFSGHKVEVVIPERYAKKLDDVAAIKPVEEGEDYSKRVGAADLPPLLDAMPNSGYFKRIFISDKQNPEDAWVSQGGFNSNFISAMSMTEGELNMYKTDRTDYLRRDVLHEWSHELRYEYWEHALTWRFADAIELESKEFSLSKYADRNNGEQWAVLGERMLGNDAAAFIAAGENAPIRTVIWMRALKRSLDTVPDQNRSIDHDFYVGRQNYVHQHILPLAMEKINRYRLSGTPDQQRRANDLYKFLEEEGLLQSPPVVLR